MGIVGVKETYYHVNICFQKSFMYNLPFYNVGTLTYSRWLHIIGCRYMTNPNVVKGRIIKVKFLDTVAEICF